MFRGLLFSAAFLVTVGYFAQGPVLSRVVKKKLVSSVKTDCPSCVLEIGALQISLVTGQVHIEHIQYSGDPRSNSVLTFAAERIVAHVDPLSFFKDAPHIKSIDAVLPFVTITEKANTPPAAHPAFPSPGLALKPFPPARVDRVRIYGGSFIYELSNHGELGQIHVNHINGNISRFATRESLLKSGYRQPLLMVATAQLETSGSVKFRVEFDPYAERNHDTITLEVRGQKMDELNHFFRVESGMTLSGILQQGKATMTVSEGHLSGTLEGSYEDLKLQYHPTPERGKLSSVVSNVVTALKTNKTRPDKHETQPPEAKISAQREPYEPITKFLIRGLRDAARQVLTS